MAHRFLLYPMVFISGASVLAVEILGTRVLGPFYGVSLFLWSALITVTLIALSIGYMLGGRWADRGTRFSRLCYLMIGAGIWLLLIPWLKHPLLDLGETFGLRFAVLIAAFVLFAPPLTLLGMISPYAIRLRAERLEEVGRTAGDLYAISTIGSVIAALLTGFVLIPSIGVNHLMMLIGAFLLLTALIGLLISRQSKRSALLAIGLLLVLPFGTWSVFDDKADPDKGLMAISHSPYAEIRVVDKAGKRYLIIDGGVHTIIDPQSGKTHFPYVAVVDLARELFEQPGEMLLIGLGGGTVARNYARDGWQVDAVEIDPVVTGMAHQFFGLRKDECQVHEEDGRQFLLTTTRRFDVIVMDAFGSSSIPFHLVTREAFDLIRSRLKEGGVLVMNMESYGWHGPLVQVLAATLGVHFRQVWALPAYQPQDTLGNVILFAANRELNLDRQWQEMLPPPGYLQTLEYRRDFAWNNRFAPDTTGYRILTDDLNPVQIISEQINYEARKGLHRFFERKELTW